MIKGDRKKYTIIFLKLLNITANTENIEKYSLTFWHNTRTKNFGGLRLSDEGYNTLKDNNLEFYKISIPKKSLSNGQALLSLDKFMDCPYYFDKSFLYVTTQKKALEFLLLDGNIKQYGFVKALSEKNLLKKVERK